MCREDFLAYCYFIYKNFESPKHLKYLSKNLTKVETGMLDRLILAMPPRHGKTLLTSVLFVAWYLGKNPSDQVIYVTYGQDPASIVGRQVRNILASPKHQTVFPACRISDDSSAAHAFTTTAGGGYLAAGRGGPLTGHGADLLLVDDPFKDATEANSDQVRDNLKEWYGKVAYTRLSPKGAVIVIHTRWHVDDLIGWLLREHSEECWEVVNFPAIAESDDDWRKEGEALWPERFPIEKLRQIQENAADGFPSLYQQRPTLHGGYRFNRDWIRYYKKAPHPTQINRYILVDPANTNKKWSDASAYWVIGLGSDHNYYVLDIVRDFLNLAERTELLFTLHRTWHPHAVGYESYGLQTDIPHIKDKQDQQNYHFEITELGGIVKKSDRIDRLIGPFKEHRFYFPEELIRMNKRLETQDLVKHFIEKEYVLYPGAPHDDLLDALARLFDPKFSTYFPMNYDNDSWEKAAKKSHRGSWMSEGLGKYWGN